MPPDSDSKSALGRPRALDEIKRREICALITAGCGTVDAARYVGCAVSTIHREAKRNVQFSYDLKRAHLAAELTPLHALRHAARTHWRAAAWLLERTNPQRFAKQNAKFIKPEDLVHFSQAIVDIIAEEIPDGAKREHIASRLAELTQHIQREIWLADHDPAPQLKRKRQAANRARTAARPNHLRRPAEETPAQESK
jgi:hypothetical protein